MRCPVASAFQIYERRGSPRLWIRWVGRHSFLSALNLTPEVSPKTKKLEHLHVPFFFWAIFVLLPFDCGPLPDPISSVLFPWGDQGIPFSIIERFLISSRLRFLSFSSPKSCTRPLVQCPLPDKNLRIFSHHCLAALRSFFPMNPTTFAHPLQVFYPLSLPPVQKNLAAFPHGNLSPAPMLGATFFFHSGGLFVYATFRSVYPPTFHTTAPLL